MQDRGIMMLLFSTTLSRRTKDLLKTKEIRLHLFQSLVVVAKEGELVKARKSATVTQVGANVFGRYRLVKTVVVMAALIHTEKIPKRKSSKLGRQHVKGEKTAYKFKSKQIKII